MAIAAKYAIINRIKNFISSRGRSWSIDQRSDISEDMAKKIQHSAYERSLRKMPDTFYPSYLEIADQLQVNNPQVVRAAAYNLMQIALNNDHYRNHISQLLEHALTEGSLNAEDQDYIRSKIKQIKYY